MAVMGTGFVPRSRLSRTIRIYLVGYVDYIDAFNDRRRHGFERLYEPIVATPAQYPHPMAFNERMNLFLFAQRNYNYDRQREEDEGKDWGKEYDQIRPRKPVGQRNRVERLATCFNCSTAMTM